MLRTSLRSARLLGGKPSAAVAGRQWPTTVSQRSSLRGKRLYADQKKAGYDASKAPILPTSETRSSERAPPTTLDDVGETKAAQIPSVPLTPPSPPSAKESQPRPATTEDDVGESKALGSSAVVAPAPPQPPSPPPPRRGGFFRRLRSVFYILVVLPALLFGGGVWYARVNDNFHDFFTEHVPFGEQAVLYLEEMEFKRKFPNARVHGSRPRQTGEQIKIPAQSGASWRVADSGEPSGRHSSASPSVKQASPSKTPKAKPESKPEPRKPSAESSKPASPSPSPPASASQAAANPANPTQNVTANGATTSQGFKAPEVNEPSKFPPLQPIDLMKLPDAKEPVVQDLVRMLNDLILVINADGAHGKYSTTIAKAKTDVMKVGGKLKDLKSSIEKKAAGEVRTTIDDFDKAATELISRVENAMVSQETQWRQEFESEMKKVRESYDERVKLLMGREKQLSDEKLQNQLLEQAVALKKEFAKDLKGRVEEEREGRLARLDELSKAVANLDTLAVGWKDVVDSNLQTQQLHVAVESVRASLEDSQHPRPFIRELVALKEIANDDAVINAAVASINPSAYQRGISTSSQLIDRFRRVASEVRKASLLPDEAGVASHASSWVLSHVMFKKRGLAEGDDVESILTRTQTYLEEGDLDGATREMNELQGWAKTLSKDWLGEARKVLEVQQALDVMATEARLQSLRVD